MPTQVSTPILIVGAGPVGLCLALFLDYWGQSCTLLNTGTSARIHPKGNGSNARTMEHYRQIGLVDEICKLGLPDDHPFDHAFFTRLSKHELYRHKCPSWAERRAQRDAAAATDQYVEPMYHVNQMYVEQFLMEKVKLCKNVEMRLGYEVREILQTNDFGQVNAVKLDDLSEFDFLAEHVVDCSGGKSLIRRHLNIRYVADTRQQDVYMAGLFLSVWLRIPELYPKHLGNRRAWVTYPINHDGDTRGMWLTLNGRDEFMILLKAPNLEEEARHDTVLRSVSKAIGDPDIEVEILGLAPWTAGSAVTVESYQKGRVFLAGDAAHLFTPVGGFGMNTGIDDTHNIAWKLAAVHQGWGGSQLLESYDIERRPIGVRNSRANREYSDKWRDPKIPKDLEELTPAGENARQRAREMAFIQHNHFCVPEEEDCTGVQLGALYDTSPLIIRDGEPPEDKWPERYNRYHPSHVPGGRLPHLWMDEKHDQGSSIFDKLGKGFTLLILRPCTANVEPFHKICETRGVPFKVLDVDKEEAQMLYKRQLLLVRPDQYIAWSGNSPPEDCADLFDQICGHSGCSVTL